MQKILESSGSTSLDGRMTLGDVASLPATLGKYEVGALFGIHPVTVCRLAKQGRIPGSIIGNRWVFSTRAILALLGE